MEYKKIENIDFNDKKICLMDETYDISKKDINKKTTKYLDINSTLLRNILIIIIILLLFLLLFFLKINIPKTITPENNNTQEIKKEPDRDELYDYDKLRPMNYDIYKQESFSSRTQSFKKAKNFLENNIKGILTKEPPTTPIENPIASAVIPVYNSKDYISRAIKSIQNQNIMNLEIILVNDNSTDDSLSLIQEIQKGDQRIKIINNQKNKGILYSRCIGVLSAKGKYIFPLDNDDMFLDDDVFQTITNIAEKGYFDIVEFKGIFSKKGGPDILQNKIGDTKYANHPLNLVLYQPELGNYQLWESRSLKSYHLESVYLWAKCIRTEIYQKAINKLGKEKYNTYIIRYEDIMMNYAIFNTARSYKFVGKYGVLYIYRHKSASTIFSYSESDRYHIIYLDIAINFVQDRIPNKKVLVHLILFLFDRLSLKKTLKSEEVNKLFISCIDRVLKMDKISDELKNEIRQKGKKLKFIKYSF